jgi:hypothetical protein
VNLPLASFVPSHNICFMRRRTICPQTFLN